MEVQAKQPLAATIRNRKVLGPITLPVMPASPAIMAARSYATGDGIAVASATKVSAAGRKFEDLIVQNRARERAWCLVFGEANNRDADWRELNQVVRSRILNRD